MDTTENHSHLPSDFGILHWQMEMGFIDALVVTMNGVVALVPATEVKSSFTPDGEFHLYGDIGAIAEHQIDLIARDTNSGAVTLMLTDGTCAMLEPVQFQPGVITIV
ncbi:hypothetical protein [Erythrobacter aureus]|uniref:Uncharacterized protein n=1 Tax=Erythrobacter aureus TaxID=2182384 RepID=A0A345YIZ6_9SPHN|nr:hypothetical protein [Erythrobacter aureus]AXK43898.1 hypothetical protein DVR09_15705 [Erythrobacter aureus]